MSEKIGIAKVNYDKVGGLKLYSRLFEVEKYFTKKEYVGTVELARELFERGAFNLCEKQLAKLPSSAELLEKLVKKLKGKSIQKVLERIQKGGILSNSIMLKGLSSLLTHTAIEVEHGNVEYKLLLPSIYEKVGEVLYNLLSEN